MLNEAQDLPAAAPLSAPLAPQKSLAIRDLSRLIADIRRARIQFERVDETATTVPLEAVMGADPRD
jgi:hypothetical protein